MTGQHWWHLERLVGLPWAEGGRSMEGCDCWGLMCLAYDWIMGFELPAYTDLPCGATQLARMVDRETAEWIRVDNHHRKGDVLLFRGLPPHVGMNIGHGKMLHMPRGVVSVIEPYRSPIWAPKLEGVFRHPRLAGLDRP